MMPSADGKTVVASVSIELINPHKIRPTDRNGKNSSIGALKILPKIMPIHAIETPIDIVIQKGPKLERR